MKRENMKKNWDVNGNLPSFWGACFFLWLRYKDESTVVGYELLNEPEAPEGTQLVSLYQQAIAAIRAIDNKHIIFLDGNNYAYDLSMFNPPLLGDNIMYVFHTYLSLGETQSKVQQYKAFQTNFQVPIMNH